MTVPADLSAQPLKPVNRKPGFGTAAAVALFESSWPVVSIQALQADGYGALVFAGRDEAALQAAVNTNIEHVFNRLGRN